MKKDFLVKYKCILLIICLLILLIFLVFHINKKNKSPIVETFSVDSTTKKEITDELVIALFMEKITDEILNFYSEFYSGEMIVYNYEITIKEIGRKEPGFISITFGVTPQVGAHNPLGYDELTYLVDASGKKSLADYKHLKNYEVPEGFQKYFIKPLE